MHGLLQKLFAKKGIKGVDELSEEEKTLYDNYDKVLSKKELGIGDIKLFLEMQIEVIEGKWRDLNLDSQKKASLIPYHTVYKTLLEAIRSPEAERANLESYLNQLVNQ